LIAEESGSLNIVTTEHAYDFFIRKIFHIVLYK